MFYVWRFMNKHLKYIIRNMCQIADVDFNSVDFKASDWFMQHSWNEEQQEKFHQFFITYLKSDKEARQELMQRPSKNKRDLEKVYQEFNLNWGWKNES